MIDGDEDWFYDSISRYKNLNMFELEYPVDNLESASENSICISCSNTKKHQLLELVLPSKLTVQMRPNPATVKITNDTDLKIKCGIFTRSRVAYFQTVKNQKKLIASHFNNPGAIVYKLSIDDSDEILEESLLKCPLEGAQLLQCRAGLVMSKDSNLPAYILNTDTGQIVRTLSAINPNSRQVEPVTPIFMDDHLIALGNQSTGCIQMFDTRSYKPIKSINVGPGMSGNVWAFTCAHKNSRDICQHVPTSCLAVLSDKGYLNIYDSRYWLNPQICENLGLNTTSPLIKINLTYNGYMSVSGFNGDVYVYSLQPKPELVFVHDGHRHVEGFSPLTFTSSHLWFRNIDNLVISSAINGTVQAWQFEKTHFS